MADVADTRDRAGLYRLLAELFLDQPDRPLLALARTVPALAGHATVEAAQSYTHVFVLNAYPFASVYLDPDGTVGGARAGFTRGVLEALGLEVEEGLAADHAAVLFGAAGALLEREAAAPSVLDAERARHGQRTLLADHLLPWFPHFLDAVERFDDGLYGAAAALARRLLKEHARELFDGRGAATARGSGPREHLRGLPRSDVDTGPDAKVATRADAPPTRGRRAPTDASPLIDLTRPARCGFFMARADVFRLAAELGLPVRFGGRAFMLDSLVQSAAQADAGARLEAALTRFTDGRRGVLEGWSVDVPALAHLWRDALARLDATAGGWQAASPPRAAGDAAEAPATEATP